MHIKILALAIAGALLLSGCGDDSSSDHNDENSSGTTEDPESTENGDVAGDGGEISDDVSDNDDTQENDQVDDEPEVVDVVEKVAAEITFVRLEDWKGGATAAYSMIHDDFCQTETAVSRVEGDGTVENWRKLEEHGLVAAFGAVANWCGKRYSYAPSEFNGQTYFQIMAAMQQAGMEIVNHTFSHKVFFELDGNNVDKDNPLQASEWQAEINEAYTLFQDNHLEINYFAFPQDQSNDTMLGYLKDQDYIGARGGTHDINAADMVADGEGLAPFKANFDCFNFNQKESHGYDCSRYSSNPLQQYLDATIADGGWGVRELHGIDTSSWGYVTPAQYETHLDVLEARVDAGDLWVATPTTVTKYWAAKTYCGEPVVTGNNLSYDSYSDPGNCITYGQGTKLDIVISSTAANGIYAEQDESSIEVKTLGNNRYRLSLDPYGSTISVYESE